MQRAKSLELADHRKVERLLQEIDCCAWWLVFVYTVIGSFLGLGANLPNLFWMLLPARDGDSGGGSGDGWYSRA